MSFKIVVLAKQVPDTHNVGADAMNADGTVNRAALPTVFNPEDLKALDAEEIILATGAKARKLPIPGFDGPNTVEAVDYLLGRKSVGEKVVIIGGGLTGCEIAYDLALKGKKPVIVEMQDDILKIMGLSAANSNMLREIIRYYDIPVHVSTALKEIRDGEVLAKDEKGETVSIPADSVILSVGYVSAPLVGEEEGRVHVLGDASKVGNLMSVIYQAYDIAYKI